MWGRGEGVSARSWELGCPSPNSSSLALISSCEMEMRERLLWGPRVTPVRVWLPSISPLVSIHRCPPLICPAQACHLRLPRSATLRQCLLVV